jgi:hypothetical protein
MTSNTALAIFSGVEIRCYVMAGRLWRKPLRVSLSGVKHARKSDQPFASYQNVLEQKKKVYLDTQESKLGKDDIYFLRIDGMPLNKICRSIIQHCVVKRFKTTPSSARKRIKMPQLCGNTEAPA